MVPLFFALSQSIFPISICNFYSNFFFPLRSICLSITTSKIILYIYISKITILYITVCIYVFFKFIDEHFTSQGLGVTDNFYLFPQVSFFVLLFLFAYPILPLKRLSLLLTLASSGWCSLSCTTHHQSLANSSSGLYKKRKKKRPLRMKFLSNIIKNFCIAPIWFEMKKRGYLKNCQCGTKNT